MNWGYDVGGVMSVSRALTGIVGISAGWTHGLALKSNRTVLSFGVGLQGQTNVPPGLSEVIAVAGGGYHSLALKRDGTVVAWGDNSTGQTNVPSGLTNVAAIAGGGYHSLALKWDGTVVAWGTNDFGQLNVPPGLGGVVAIACGAYHSLALRSDGTVAAWGGNTYHQTELPLGLNNVVAIACGVNNSLALQGNGSPIITVPPVSRTVDLGANVLMQALVVGTPPLQWQWAQNGETLTDDYSHVFGASSPNLTLLTTTPEQAGVYEVLVANNLGAAVSAPATLTVGGFRFLEAQLTSSNLVRLSIAGTPGQVFTLLGSTNLVSWSPLATLTNITGTVEFIDNRGPSAGRLFYRASIP
jgi:hypothetical protein